MCNFQLNFPPRLGGYIICEHSIIIPLGGVGGGPQGGEKDGGGHPKGRTDEGGGAPRKEEVGRIYYFLFPWFSC